MRDAIRLAVGTFTAVPTPPPVQVGRAASRGAILLAPATAVPLVALAVVAHLVVVAGAMPAVVAAAAVLGLTALWSRGLHLDGLSDTVDGLSAGPDRERALEVMHRGDAGPTGVAALVLVLLVQVAAMSSLVASRRGTALVVVAVLASRYALAWGCWERVRAARHTGLGAAVAGSVPDLALAAATSIMLGLAVAISVLSGARWYAGPLVVAAGALAAGWVLSVALRRLGGVTGDVLGATVEAALAGALVVASMLG